MSFKNLSRLFILFVFFLLNIHLQAQFYNGSHNEFGKNRVQYDEFKWQFIRQPRFEVYYYEGGKEPAEYVVRVANQNMRIYEEFFDFYFTERLQFILYNKLSHFQQSNAGIADEENYNTGGVVKIFGNKVFLYFEGSHLDLEQQIKAGIAEALLNQMVYGDNWREVLKNSTLLSLPDWYMKGLISYLSKPWDWTIEDFIEDGIKNKKFKSFNKLSGEQAILAGHSLWYYIAQSYGEKVIPNIISMVRITRSIESGYLYVLGMSSKSLTREWINYYEDYVRRKNSGNKPFVSNVLKKTGKRHLQYRHLSYNPELKQVAYVTHKMGKYKIWIHDIESNKRFKIFKGGIKLDRINDTKLPVVKWHPNGKTLVFFTERKGEMLIHFYDSETGVIDQKPIFNLEKVLDFDIAPNGREIVFSAFHKGQTDLYLYNSVSNSQKQLTNDVFDDLMPVFSKNGEEIFFVSNRSIDSLHIDVPNLYYPDLYHLYRGNLKQMADLKNPYPLQIVDNEKGTNKYMPLSTDSGVYYLKEQQSNLVPHFAKFDSSIAFVDTAIHYRYFYTSVSLDEWPNNIRYYDFGDSRLFYFKKNKWRDYLFIASIDDLSKKHLNQIAGNDDQNQYSDDNLLPYIVQPIIEPMLDSSHIDYNNYKFEQITRKTEDGITINKKVIMIGGEGEKNRKEESNQFKIDKKSANFINDTGLVIQKPRVYFLSFFTDESITQLNSNFVNGQYQIFNGGPFIAPGLGAVMKMGISDIFEDYKVYGGVRFGGASMEYFIGYQNLKYRADKEWLFTRRTNRNGNEFSTYQFITDELNYSWRYPFSAVASIRTTIKLRHDQIVTKANESFSLQVPDFHDYWGVLRMAYVFDNTKFVMLNILNGTRFKIWGEYYQQIQKNDDKFYYLFSNVPAFDKQRYNVFVAGLDFRHYQKIHREITFVTRLAGGTSFGKQKLIYYLGSVDDWIIFGKTPRFNYDQAIDYTQNYRFQTLASPMRGFNQNIRNGNSFAVINTELRWPVFKYFIRRPIKSSFISNFQIVGFGDLGTAWNGLDPFSSENSINRKIIQDGPLTIVLYDSSYPIVGGYGFGLRSRILGYFVRTDWAWGVVDGKVQKPIFYLSLCLDI